MRNLVFRVEIFGFTLFLRKINFFTEINPMVTPFCRDSLVDTTAQIQLKKLYSWA